MDMQPRVFFRISNPQRVIEEIEAKLFPEGHADFSGVVAKEYYAIDVYFECAEQSAILEIEKLSGIDGFEELLPGHSKQIYTGGDSEDMIIPDEYLIRVRTANSIYESYYRIEPIHYTPSTLEHLRTYLEKILHGLTYQLQKKRTGTYTSSTENVPPAILIMDRIIQQYRPIINRLESIVRNPITDVVKVYHTQSGSKKPDPKSQRWLVGKGSSKNSVPQLPNTVYEKHAELSVDNVENYWAKKILYYIRSTIRKIEVGILESVTKKESVYEELIKQKEDIEKKLVRTKNTPYRSNLKTINLESDLMQLDRRLNANKKELLELEERKVIILRIASSLSRYEQSPWLQDVGTYHTSKVTVRMLRDARYGFLYRLYKELMLLEKPNRSTKKATYARKKNSLLLEYYSVAICISILESLGFSWKSGWIADTLNPLMIELEPGTPLIFENETHLIELSYDTEVERSHTVDENPLYSRYVGEKHRRPDIRISLIDKINNKHLRGLIIEVKYRRFVYLWNNDVDTEVMEQVKAYKDLKYYDATARKMENKIDKVIVLYPKQKNTKPVLPKHANSIIFLQIEPSDPELELKPFGYAELEQILFDFINQNK